ncbi:uncharacterized protein CDAR_15281 [Caerostris darwini]|uniref:Uncharacterized protein n=1 Tax=Caerostris darwini TaxID=1538125 RepID=A0AAV4QMA6_9ARAC|nr:uncharacterized protein CDAR_15281 [Caerostris darwini]
MSINRFLPLQNAGDILQHINNRVVENSNESCALIGDDNLLKSSFLFQAALSIAKEGDQVFFICPTPLENRPYHVLDLPEPSHLVLQCIKMIYIEKPSDLLQYLCEFHTKETFPAAIMIDDIQYYVSHLDQDGNKEASLVKLFAILEDTVVFIREACHRMISLSRSSCSKNYIKRYFRELWHVSNGEKEGEYFLTDEQVPAIRATFHLRDDQKIVLDKIYKLHFENETENAVSE